MNQIAIQKELAQLEAELAVTSDKYDVHFLQNRIKSLKVQLTEVTPKDYNEVFGE
jgi:hypothetical protein